MLETAETGEAPAVARFQKLEPQLRTQLIQMQQRLRAAPFSVIILVAGDDPAAARDVVNLFSEWLDPRSVATRFFSDPSEEELQHPSAWRFWRELPAAGRIGVFCDEWTTRILSQRLRGKLGAKQFQRMLDEAARYERMLAAESSVILKLYLHAPAAELRRQKKLISRTSSWSDIAVVSRALLDHPKRTRAVIENTLQATDSDLCPWRLIESSCKRFRKAAAARLLLETVQQRFDAAEGKGQTAPAPRRALKPAGKSVLDAVDLSQKLSQEQYEGRMQELKREINALTGQAAKKGVSTVCVFEGWDAAGKGGAIRRLTLAMNPENYRTIPIAAPTDEERAHHYLWRFWRHIPRDGGIVIFDRSWYGRVLVERVEHFATPQQWNRAYEEINYFEQQLSGHGNVVLKFWLHIDQDEQLRRFKEREKIAFKRYKIGPEDYRNRGKWDPYVQAVNDMVARTSTPDAPWHLVAANDKKFGRVEVMELVAQRDASG